MEISTPPSGSNAAPAPISSFSVLAARLFWMLLGPLLLIAAFYGAVKLPGWLSAADLAVLVIFAGMIAARWYEQRSGSATTASGEPATPEHFRRYARAVAIGGAIAWLTANILGNYVL